MAVIVVVYIVTPVTRSRALIDANLCYRLGVYINYQTLSVYMYI